MNSAGWTRYLSVVKEIALCLRRLRSNQGGTAINIVPAFRGGVFLFFKLRTTKQHIWRS